MDAPPHCLFYSAARVPDALLEKRNPRGPGPQILSSAAPFIFSPPSFSRGSDQLSLLSRTFNSFSSSV